jgi:hypothetical protein
VASLAEYHTLERQLEQAGFKHDRRPEAPVCRWIVAGCMLDVMPTDESALGFGNRWYKLAVRSAQVLELPSGQSIRLIAPAVFLATKLDAFRGRGAGDFLASHDLEDVVVLIDGGRIWWRRKTKHINRLTGGADGTRTRDPRRDRPVF